MDPTRLNSAVATLRKVGDSMRQLDLAEVEANARLFGTGLSKAGQGTGAAVEHREEVRAAIEELARRARSFLEAHRDLEELLG
jgi:hypothetical protein